MEKREIFKNACSMAAELINQHDDMDVCVNFYGHVEDGTGGFVSVSANKGELSSYHSAYIPFHAGIGDFFIKLEDLRHEIIEDIMNTRLKKVIAENELLKEQLKSFTDAAAKEEADADASETENAEPANE